MFYTRAFVLPRTCSIIEIDELEYQARQVLVRQHLAHLKNGEIHTIRFFPLHKIDNYDRRNIAFEVAMEVVKADQMHVIINTYEDLPMMELSMSAMEEVKRRVKRMWQLRSLDRLFEYIYR